MTSIIQGGSYLADRGHLALGPWMSGLLGLGCGGALLLGLLTPIAGLLVGLGGALGALSWLPLPNPNLLDTRLVLMFVIIVALAIILLGPGAFSLDARLFGRREIIIPHPSRPPKL